MATRAVVDGREIDLEWRGQMLVVTEPGTSNEGRLFFGTVPDEPPEWVTPPAPTPEPRERGIRADQLDGYGGDTPVVFATSEGEQ